MIGLEFTNKLIPLFLKEIKHKIIIIEKQKHIALVAHDDRKQDLIDWVLFNKSELVVIFLVATGTTARLLLEQVTLPVKAYTSLQEN